MHLKPTGVEENRLPDFVCVHCNTQVQEILCISGRTVRPALFVKKLETKLIIVSAVCPQRSVHGGLSTAA